MSSSTSTLQSTDILFRKSDGRGNQSRHTFTIQSRILKGKLFQPVDFRRGGELYNSLSLHNFLLFDTALPTSLSSISCVVLQVPAWVVASR